ncbi:integrase family protein [Luteimonas sp. RD2P54]|uniref:Integrase family protein n=1 Tax=Luteimonas endophytica TaxID=3042023 RepID=A0ABT6JC05_9GAMM|nr:integrase family protein [Luteimonas endophytica]MDH5824331.1 integrase family protein [Luteimonas endophytica]
MPRVTREALTEKSVKDAKATGRLYRLRDARVPGLLLRVNATGAKAWAITWGRGQERIIGAFPVMTLDMARTQSRMLLAQVAEHGAPTPKAAPDTVADACREYVAGLRKEGRKATGDDAERRFERTVYADRIGKVRLSKLTQDDVEGWRDRVERGELAELPTKKGRPPQAKPLTKASVNRMRTVLVAALNRAVSRRKVTPDRVIEWANVKPYEKVGSRRDLYIDRQQRRALLANATPDVRDLMECVALTGCRPGDPAAVLRCDYDARHGTVTFRTKGHARTVPLSPAAQTLLDRLAKDKLPAAHLFTNGGAPWRPHDWREPVKDAARKAELSDAVVLYTLRHCWITDAIVGGMDLLTVAKLAGTSLAMIEKHYGHLVQGAAREKLAAVEFL